MTLLQYNSAQGNGNVYTGHVVLGYQLLLHDTCRYISFESFEFFFFFNETGIDLGDVP